VKLSAEKITNPILSLTLPRTKSSATSFAASRRLGEKSSESILPEISRTKTISIPSVVALSPLATSCGRAKAIIKNAKANSRNATGIRLNRSFSDLDVERNGSSDENFTSVTIVFRFHQTYAIIAGINNSKYKNEGFAK
jgi:hypothetical protein